MCTVGVSPGTGWETLWVNVEGQFFIIGKDLKWELSIKAKIKLLCCEQTEKTGQAVSL